eukprot:TRINITY_DN3274_c0_g1_i3.p3 TRINITY_DN3274_c0_g1~~TRINITY_DN3274_c0_g1_i3.p3  ORF type:complete len:122 (+),score=36.63 TRINITY_DN3274_c0_g1_i3:454-819(+)
MFNAFEADFVLATLAPEPDSEASNSESQTSRVSSTLKSRSNDPHDHKSSNSTTVDTSDNQRNPSDDDEDYHAPPKTKLKFDTDDAKDSGTEPKNNSPKDEDGTDEDRAPWRSDLGIDSDDE